MSTSRYKEFLGIPYNFNHSPLIETEVDSLNCQRLIHLIYRIKFNLVIPKPMLSAEIFYDESVIFRSLVPGETAIEGDIGVFGPKKINDPRVFHLAYFTGEKDIHQNPILLHATVYGRQVLEWPLSMFFTKPKYEDLKRIKRVRPEIINASENSHILTLG